MLIAASPDRLSISINTITQNAFFLVVQSTRPRANIGTRIANFETVDQIYVKHTQCRDKSFAVFSE